MRIKILYIDEIKTRIGYIKVAVTSNGLAAVSLPSDKMAFDSFIKREFSSWKIVRSEKMTKKAARQINLYLDGKLKKFNLKLDLRTTLFRREVLRKVAAIPYGKTRTYGEIARQIGRIKAQRAVGSANAANPIPIVIPCHRVVAASGIGGYAGGTKMKKLLLEMEATVSTKKRRKNG
jgi:O-6-methylguanine DNA methyltransferase